MTSFTEIFKSLREPFCLGSSIPSTGTYVSFRESKLELIVYENGSVCNRFVIDRPDPQEVLTGFDAMSFFEELDKLKGIIRTFEPSFADLEHIYHQPGDTFELSTKIKLITTGAMDVGYFDLVLVGKNNEITCNVDYSSKISQLFRHSGDLRTHLQTHCMGHLIHKIDFEEICQHGYVALVGFQGVPLTRWYGKVAGLFVVDERNAVYVPLDLSSAVVLENTVIVPLMYQLTSNGSKWHIPSRMQTFLGNTKEVHSSTQITTLLNEFHFPEPTRVLLSAVDLPFNISLDETSIKLNEDKEIDGMQQHQVPLQIAINPHQIFSKWNAVYLGKTLATEFIEQDIVVPFRLPKDNLQGRVVLLMQDTRLEQNMRLLQDRHLVFHVHKEQGFDAAFLHARQGIVTRFNAVFIVHVEHEDDFSIANMSIPSYYAGPRATIVYVCKEKYYLQWATPVSVIPREQTIDSTPEWIEFPSLLEAYLTSPPVNSMIEIAIPEEFELSLGKFGSITFNGLEEKLQTCIDYPIQDKVYIVNCLFGFEYVLDKKPIQQMQQLVRKIFKSAFSAAKRTELFQELSQLRATKEIKAEITLATKTIARLANLFTCRKFIVVNKMLAEFQKKKREHGEKAAEKMDLGMECKEFVKNGDIVDLLETVDEFMLLEVCIPELIATIKSAQAPNQPLAQLNARVPTLDGTTIECLLDLNIPHELETKSTAMAIPIEDDYFDVKSCIFLPIFEAINPDLTTFNVNVWAYVLVEGIKSSSIMPRDVNLKPRQVEYIMIYFLISFMEKLCSQRTNKVLKSSANDTLVMKIRSVYWLIRALMIKNVGLLTPEPVMELLSHGRSNNVTELDIGLRLYPLICKTGLPSYHATNLKKSIYEVLLRMLYTPFKDSFAKLLERVKKLDLEVDKELIAFYAKSKEVDSTECTPRIRPKKCKACGVVKSKHEFPRKHNKLVSDGKPTEKEGLGREICFNCHGFNDPVLICCSRNCEFSGDYFQFVADSKYTTCYQCIAIKPGRKRQVPPKYSLIAGGKICKKRSISGTLRTYETEVSSVLSITIGKPIFIEKQLNLEKIEERLTLASESIKFKLYLSMCIRSGLITNEEDAPVELTNLVCLMINHVEEVPSWKYMVDEALADKHKRNTAPLMPKFTK